MCYLGIVVLRHRLPGETRRQIMTTISVYGQTVMSDIAPKLATYLHRIYDDAVDS